MNLPDLDQIAGILEGLEETIIQKLIDRVQFRLNKTVYEPGKSGFAEETASLFDLRLRSQEEMDAVFGRFLMPEERPRSSGLPEPKRRFTKGENVLAVADYDLVNLCPEIQEGYLALVPEICEAGDDGHYGSSTEHDVYAFQAIARRIHFGAFYVAESKWRADPALYRELAAAGAPRRIEEALTRPEVERAVVDRVRVKAEKLQATVGDESRGRRRLLPPEPVSAFYRNVVIPLTRKGEVLYLLNRRRSD